MALEYWQKRLNAQMDVIYSKSVDEIEAEEIKQYINIQKNVIRELNALYNEIQAKGGAENVLVSHIYKYDKYYKMLQNVNKQVRNLGLKEIQIIEPRFVEMYAQTSSIVADTFSIKSASESLVKKAVNSVWCSDGLCWSDRIWKNKALLVSELEKGLVDCVARGASSDELTKTIMEKFDVSYNNARRLVRTELAHLQNDAALDRYKAAGVKEVEICAANDTKVGKDGKTVKRTCQKCLDNNGKIVAIDNMVEGENVPLFHVMCRCTILPVVHRKDIKDSVAKKMKP